MSEPSEPEDAGAALYSTMEQLSDKDLLKMLNLHLGLARAAREAEESDTEKYGPLACEHENMRDAYFHALEARHRPFLLSESGYYEFGVRRSEAGDPEMVTLASSRGVSWYEFGFLCAWRYKSAGHPDQGDDQCAMIARYFGIGSGKGTMQFLKGWYASVERFEKKQAKAKARQKKVS